MTTPIRLLIADDHAIAREGIVAIVSQADDMDIVAEADDGAGAIALYQKHQPDVGLIDLRMPNVDGVSTITQILAAFPKACLIILTTYNTDEDIYRGLQAGAKGYLLKDTTSEELLKAIRTVHQGRKYIPPEVALKLAERINSTDLTEREMDVLRSLVSGKSNQEIGADLSITGGTVKFHINNILTKLGAGDRTQAVVMALKRGLVRLD
ncbi:MAG: response regulator [Elainellaceae cyanobacterium]